MSEKMDDLINAFLEYKRHNMGRSERTAEVYRLALLRLVEYCRDIDLDPLHVGRDHLLAFTGIWLHKRGLQDPVSRRTHIAAVRQFYGWMVDTRKLASNPAETLPYPRKGMKIPRVMTLASAEKMMWGPDFSTFEGVRDGAMLSILVGCGLRVSGLVRLNESDIVQDEIDGQVRLYIKVTEKGEKQRRMPIPPEADLLLRLYLEHPDLKDIQRALPNGDQVLFVTTRNRSIPPHEYNGDARRFNRRSVLAMIKRYGERAGIPEDQLHPHAMRHLFGTELIEDDVNLLNTQKLMGHADPKSTEIYTHTAMRKLTKEVDRANPLAKMNTPVSQLLKQLQVKPLK
jgi:integrase/recombinase XerD